MAISKSEIWNQIMYLHLCVFPNFKFQISNFIAKIKDQQNVNYFYVPLNMGANWIRRGYGSLSGVPGPCNLAKKQEKTQTPTLITSTHWPLRSATSNLVCLWTGIRWKFSRLASSGCLSLWEQKFSKLAWFDPAWVRQIRQKIKIQATHVDA